MKCRIGALLLAATLLAACARPIPEEHRALVGTWEGPGMLLRIDADGTLAYRRTQGSGTASIDAPIQEIGADHFTAGVGPMSAQFRIDRAPRLENGAWTMTVGGVALRRRDDGATPPVAR